MILTYYINVPDKLLYFNINIEINLHNINELKTFKSIKYF